MTYIFDYVYDYDIHFLCFLSNKNIWHSVGRWIILTLNSKHSKCCPLVIQLVHNIDDLKNNNFMVPN